MEINKINKISIYLLHDGFFNSALFSSENEINSDFIILKKPKISITIIPNIPKHLKFSEKKQLWIYKHKQKSKLLHLEL